MDSSGRRCGFLSIAVLLGGFADYRTGNAAQGANERPNFVLFLVDDVGYADVGVQGAQGFRTPHLDQMAREGTRFTDFYVHPVCGVTRAALMTGCYAMRVAEVGNKKNGHPILHPEEVTIAEVLREAGYATAMIGKWHLSGGGRAERYPPELMPNAQGFEYYFGTPSHNGTTRTIEGSGFRAQLMRNDEMVDDSVDQPEMDRLTARYTEEAVRWIRGNHHRPFFLYVAHNMAHVVLGASAKFRGTSNRGLYGDAMQELDWSAGRILATLKDLGIDENTLMVFTSDNGPWVEKHLAGPTPQQDHYGRATPLRGFKMTTWEGGVRVPCIARFPGKVPAGAVCKQPAAIIDLLPTFAKLAGAELPADRIIDGRDLWPILSGQPNAESPHEAFYYYSFVHLQAVRSGKWKLVLPRPAGPPWCSWSARMIDAVPETQLFDLEADAREAGNVADAHPEVVARLMGLIEKARDDLGDYNRIGSGQRFFDPGPRRGESRRWIANAGALDQPPPPKDEDGGGPYPRSFGFTDAVGHEPGVTRRDPSDVIRVDDRYYVWYSKVKKESGVYRYPSGYSADVYYATSPDGRRWIERGLAVGKGRRGDWDEHGVFTPNVLVFQGRYYLYYTGVAAEHGETTPTQIGVAISDAPEGPWVKCDRNPVLSPSPDAAKFDSMRVDDAALVVRDGKVWLYYKGRQIDHSPGETKMGVAISDEPTGPFRKHGGAEPLHPGHEVMIWSHGQGVASLATAAGPRRVYFAPDGLDFRPRNVVVAHPRAPGAFRENFSRQEAAAEGLKWGIGHASREGDLYLVRFDAKWTADRAAQDPTPHVQYDHPPPVGNLRFDFETGDLQGWKVVEGKFEALVNGRSHFHHTLGAAPYNKQGKFFLTTLERAKGGRGDDRQTGVVESPLFTLKKGEISFLVGGGEHADTYVALVDAETGKELRTARGSNTEIMRRINWSLPELIGRRVCLRMIDRNTGSWGHVTFDDFSAEGSLAERPSR